MVDGVPVHRLPIPGPKAMASLSFTMSALPKLRSLQPDIIHAHDMFAAATTAATAKYLFGTPIVINPHRSDKLGDVYRLKHKTMGSSRIAIFRQKADAFVSISHEIKAELLEIGIPADRCFLIPNGIDAERFAPLSSEEKRALRAKLGLPDVPIVIFTGRLAPEKRVNNLITIWPAVRAVHPEALLLILGTGDEETSLKQMAGEGVQFAGLIENVAPYLQAADLFVLPSIAEGFSISLLEALSSALPAVVTNVGGAADIIDHKTNGWLLPPDDLSALQEAITALLDDADCRLRLGRQGRERVLRDFSLPVITERLAALYGQIVPNKSLVAKKSEAI